MSSTVYIAILNVDFFALRKQRLGVVKLTNYLINVLLVVYVNIFFNEYL